MSRWDRTGLVAVVLLVGAYCSGEHTDDGPMFRIGGQDLTLLSPDDGTLWDVRDVLEVDGIFWVLKASPPFVHALDGSGSHLAGFGEVGKGPGELRFPGAFQAGDAGKVTVWDTGSRAALTFSVDGSLLSATPGPGLPAVRADIETVTHGNPFRLFRHAGATVVGRFESGINHPSDLWRGKLVRVADRGPDGRKEVDGDVLVDFNRDLGGSSKRRSSRPPGLMPVPLWDGCPDGRIAVLDPITLTLKLLGPGQSEAEAIQLPWEPERLRRIDKYSYIRFQVETEARGKGADAAAIDRVAKSAFEHTEHLFLENAPAGVDLKCAPRRVWIQQFHGDSHPLGYGPHWRTVSLYDSVPRFARVALPPGFQPMRFTDSGMLGVVTGSLSFQRLARVNLSEELR